MRESDKNRGKGVRVEGKKDRDKEQLQAEAAEIKEGNNFRENNIYSIRSGPIYRRVRECGKGESGRERDGTEVEGAETEL